MRPYFRKYKLIFIPFAIAAFGLLIGLVVMNVWNAVIPAVFHLGTITFWQAIEIFILCKILFGFGGKGPGGFGGRGPWGRARMEERFKNMTPEEREKFKAKWEERCGHGRWGHHEQHPFSGGPWDKKEPETEKTTE